MDGRWRQRLGTSTVLVDGEGEAQTGRLGAPQELKNGCDGCLNVWSLVRDDVTVGVPLQTVQVQPLEVTSEKDERTSKGK